MTNDPRQAGTFLVWILVFVTIFVIGYVMWKLGHTVYVAERERAGARVAGAARAGVRKCRGVRKSNVLRRAIIRFFTNTTSLIHPSKQKCGFASRNTVYE